MKLVRMVLLGALPVVFAAGSRSLAAHPKSGIVSIGMLSGRIDSAGAAINSKGHVVGYSDAAGGVHHAVLWDGKALHALAEQSGDITSSALAINSQDLAAGARVDSNSVTHAAEWKKGKLIPLPELPGDTISVATAINDAGVVVGASQGPSTITAVMWVKGKVQALTGIPNGLEFVPAAINKKGQIAGIGQDQSRTIYPYVWLKGKLTQLPVLGTGTHSLQIGGINASGVVVAQFIDNTGMHAVTWTGGQISELSPLVGDDGGAATGINDGGDVVGVSTKSFEPTPVIWPHGGNPVSLASLAPEGSSLTIGNATGINKKRQVTGIAGFGSTFVGYVLTPKATP